MLSFFEQFNGQGGADVNIIICDDKEEDAGSLRLFIERYFNEINCRSDITVYKNGDDLLEDFAADKLKDVKIAFLDVYMPGTDGIGTARKIRETDKDMVIVFTTVSKDHGIDGFSVYALQYLLKPVSYPEIKDVLDKCTEKFADALRYVEVLSDRLTVRVYLKDVMYIESFDTVLYIHTVTDTIKTFLPFAKLEIQLENSTLLRTHRSFIVNMRFIKNVTANDFVLKDGTHIPIRRSDKLAVKQAYMDYVFARARGINNEITQKT